MERQLEYYIHPKYAAMPKLLVRIDGVMLNLKGEDGVDKTRETPKRASVEIHYKGATQEVLKQIIENKETYGDFSRIIKSRPVTASTEVQTIEEE